MKFQSLQALLLLMLLQCKDLIAEKAKETAGEHYKDSVKVINFVFMLICTFSHGLQNACLLPCWCKIASKECVCVIKIKKIS